MDKVITAAAPPPPPNPPNVLLHGVQGQGQVSWLFTPSAGYITYQGTTHFVSTLNAKIYIHAETSIFFIFKEVKMGQNKTDQICFTNS